MEYRCTGTSICVFSSTQLKNEDKTIFFFIENFINNKLNHDSGSIIQVNILGRRVINGAMKVLTGLEWINVNIHFQKK